MKTRVGLLLLFFTVPAAAELPCVYLKGVSLQARLAPSLEAPGVEASIAAALRGALSQLDLKSAQSWGDLGLVLQAHDLHELAALAYQCAYEVDPLDYRWTYLLGEIDPQDEIIWYRRSLEASEAVHGGYYRMGMAFFHRMRPTEALMLFDQLTKTPVYAAYGYLGKAFVAAIGKDGIEDAVMEAERSVHLLPKNADAHRLLSQLYTQTGNRRAAADAAWLARTLGPGLTPKGPFDDILWSLRVDSEAVLARAQRALRAGDVDAAEQQLAYLDGRTSSEPDAARTVLKAELALVRGRIDEAVSETRRLPAGPVRSRLLAKTERELGNDMSGYLETEANPIAEGGADGLWFLAELAKDLGHHSKALNWYKSLLVADPTRYLAYREIATIQKVLGDVTEYARNLTLYLRVADDDEESWLELAQLHRGTEHALPALRRYIELAPSDYEARYVFALALIGYGGAEAAEDVSMVPSRSERLFEALMIARSLIARDRSDARFQALLQTILAQRSG